MLEFIGLLNLLNCALMLCHLPSFLYVNIMHCRPTYGKNEVARCKCDCQQLKVVYRMFRRAAKKHKSCQWDRLPTNMVVVFENYHCFYQVQFISLI